MRFVPATARPYLLPPPGPTTLIERRPAVDALLTAYKSPAHLLRGGLAWFGVAVAVVLVVVGLGSIVVTLAVGSEPAATGWIGAAAVAAGIALGLACGRVGRDVIAAGRAISTAAESWLRSGPPAPNTAKHRLLGLASPLIPELFTRGILGALAWLGTVLGLSAVGYGIARAGEESGSALVLSVTMAVLALVLSAHLAVVAVALWRSTRRVQRGWVHAGGGR